MKWKRVLISLVFAYSVLFSTATLYAESISRNWKLAGGVRSMGYWLDPDCSYTGTIPAALQAWTWPGWSNPINFYSSAFSSAILEFYEVSVSGYQMSTWSGHLVFVATPWAPNRYVTDYNTLGRVYDFVKVTLNAAELEPYAMEKRKICVAHELGHAMGLNELREYANRGSLMYFHDSRTCTGITYDANQAIVAKYP